jgi:hypothetical protein
MKRTIEYVADLASKHPETKDGNILILNHDHVDRTIMKLNRTIYTRQYKLEVFPFTLRYCLWVFDYGTVDHTACQGGWTNWSMYGRFERSGNDRGFVTFFPRQS